jgi:hypothetical protein
MKKSNSRGTTIDRREEDIGPPSGWRDRRRHVERRIPQTEEVEVSDEEWVLYFVKPAQETTPVEHEAAAEVLERTRK